MTAGVGPMRRRFREADMLLDVFLPYKVRAEVREAMDKKKTVMLVTSRFLEAGEDYCAIEIEGVEVFRQAGY